MAMESDAAAPERQERRDARENRRLLLEVAKRLFAEQGVATTTMKDIAEAAGVGKGTLYRHFAHKGELCSALLHADIVAFQQRLDPLLAASAAAPLHQLDLLIIERIQMTETHLPLFAAIDEEAGSPGRARPFRPPFATWTHTHIVRLLTAAVAQGDLAPLDPDWSGDALIAIMSPQHYRFQRHECGYSVERIVAGIRHLFIAGLPHDTVVQPEHSEAHVH